MARRAHIGLIGPTTLAMVLALAAAAPATEYYLDSAGGSDDDAGTSPEEAWASLDRPAQGELGPGDAVLLRRGETFRGRLRINGSGSAEAPIRVGAWGEGHMPEIVGTVLLDGWTEAGGEVYRATVAESAFYGQRKVFSIYEYDGDLPLRLQRDDQPPTERGHFHFDAQTLTLSVITTDGRSPAQHRLEVSVIEQLMDLRDQRWLVFEDLSLLMGNCRHVVLSGCEDVVFRNCASMFVGMYGNPNFIVTGGSRRVEILDCLLYENVNCGILFTAGATECRVAGCTIARCASNDGITCHSGGTNEAGVRQGLCGDGVVIENNVIGLCPEESIDITSGDYHVVRGNICHNDGNPGIIIGHDSDHVLVENNICCYNRGGIYVTGKVDEGARGYNRVIGNLCYENTYPGLEIYANDTEALNNTIVNSRERVAVRINPDAARTVLRNNIIAMLDPTIPHMLVHFIGCTPEGVGAQISDNLLYHAADVRKPEVFFAAGQLIRTDDGAFTAEEFVARYGTGGRTIVADPQFRAIEEGLFLLGEGSPAVDAGIDVGLSFAGAAPDLGWKELGAEAGAPSYPTRLLDGGPGDREIILRLWGKAG